MEELKTAEKLSSQAYWDLVLEEAKLPRINSRRSYHYRVTMDFIDPFLRNKPYTSFFEVGCGSSGWLPYFGQEYGLTVSGIDYSATGCRLAEENLRILGIPYGEIICRDIFENNCTDGKKYDVVFSYGVIEHFENPEDIIRIFSSFLNPGGLMITLVPNLNGSMGWLSRLFIPDIYKMHRVISRQQLQRYHESNALHNLKTNYAGTFTLAVLPLIRSTHWLLREGSTQRKIALSGFSVFDKLASRTFRLLKLNIPTRRFSPYIISIAAKNI
ncbi:MAG TPA: methyltransferase domain-containing protein [Puia sp.]|jgi:2-polyprenyl-3-methyl-5-hydroxy-6-metoxy-1,4-benzoquinol methylase